MRHVATDALVDPPAHSRITDPAKLRRLVTLIDGEIWQGLGIDIKAAIYEGLLEKNATEVKSGAGQYFTPRPLIEAICNVMKPDPRGKPDFRIADPACGTGGFLACAFEHGKKQVHRPADLEAAGMGGGAGLLAGRPRRVVGSARARLGFSALLDRARW